MWINVRKNGGQVIILIDCFDIIIMFYEFCDHLSYQALL